jgi:hypothetical protein
VHDVTARKAHQWAMVALNVVAFLLGERRGAALIGAAGAVMLAGRFWWPADVVRQFVWRVLEPAGLLRRREMFEDHETRRVARVIGGAAWLGSASLLRSGNRVGWVIAAPIAVMVALDAALDFCALCFVVSQAERRGLLPPRAYPIGGGAEGH